MLILRFQVELPQCKCKKPVRSKFLKSHLNMQITLSHSPSIAWSKSSPRAPTSPIITTVIPSRPFVGWRRRPSRRRVPPITIRRGANTAAPLIFPIPIPIPFPGQWRRGTIPIIIIATATTAVRGAIHFPFISSLSGVSVSSP